MAARKNVSTEKLLGKLTPEQRKEFAAQFNTGLGSGMTPGGVPQEYWYEHEEGHHEEDRHRHKEKVTQNTVCNRAGGIFMQRKRDDPHGKETKIHLQGRN